MWLLGETHPAYGQVVMMGTTGGEAYRWFLDKHKTVSMIPLAVLKLEDEEIPSEATDL